jgi:hypothetical protein
MNKIIGISLALVLIPLLSGVAYAVQHGSLDMPNPNMPEVSSAQIQEAMAEKQASMNQMMQGLSESEKKVYESQNKIAIAVHALLASGDIEGIGPQISEIAREFENSMQATVRAESQIEERGAFRKSLAGGDHRAARELVEETERNKEMIAQLRALLAECEECGQEVKSLLMEQVRNIELEQDRMNERAREELSKKGLIGWIWKR